MKNSRMLPFERNRYYTGKSLTSADFLTEQLYMNNKRRFLNHILYGSGIVCGLNVLNLDDLSVLVESGVAIDDMGREIVVDAAVVRKLSTIEGFDSLTGEKAELCLRYTESEVHPVYCAGAAEGEKEYQFNRIDEGYELFLRDCVSEKTGATYLTDLIQEEIIADGEDYTVSLRIPAAMPKGKAVRGVCLVKKHSDTDKKLSIRFLVKLPALTDGQGKHELEIRVEDLVLKQGETVCKDYWMNVEETAIEETNIIIKKEDIRVLVGDDNLESERDIHFKAVLLHILPEELAAKEIGGLNPERKNFADAGGLIRLAELTLVKTETSYLIGSIREQGVKQFIAAPVDTPMKNEYLSYFKDRTDTPAEDAGTVTVREEIRHASGEQMQIAAGRVEIPLNVKMKKGEVAYSQEIMHGLGKGKVYVDVGIEVIDEDPGLQKKVRSTIYGNTGLFPNSDIMDVDTAVKVMNEKGSFQIAAKLLGEQKSVVLVANWVAIRCTNGSEKGDLNEVYGSIAPKMSTVRLKKKESHFFDVEFKNMPSCRLTYELTESGSGEIGNDGVYTAPAKEGVYEIYIYCTDAPGISTYAYAIVNK